MNLSRCSCQPQRAKPSRHHVLAMLLTMSSTAEHHVLSFLLIADEAHS